MEYTKVTLFKTLTKGIVFEGNASQMNMRGVFLHVMADALGSVVVIVSAIIIWQTDWEYKYYVDPGMANFSFINKSN